MKRKIKMIVVIVLIIGFIIFIHNTVQASFHMGSLDQYIDSTTTSTKLNDKLNVLFFAIRVIGITLSVIILSVIGIKYMMGSIEEKAEYKKTLIPYIIGAFLLFTGSLLPQIIYEFMVNIGWIK